MKEEKLSSNEILLKWIQHFEELFRKFGVNEDCKQMIYLDFLQYDNEKLNELNDSGEIKYWIVRFVKNYWFSKTSRYYSTYEKYYEHHTELPD